MIPNSVYSIKTENFPDYVSVTISISQISAMGYLKFRSPLEVEAYLYPTEKRAYIKYDFGMWHEVSVEQNCLKSYAEENNENDPIKTVVGTIFFDIDHAMFHYEGDPNYTTLHWALWLALHPRIEFLYNWYEMEDIAIQTEFEFT